MISVEKAVEIFRKRYADYYVSYIVDIGDSFVISGHPNRKEPLCGDVPMRVKKEDGTETPFAYWLDENKEKKYLSGKKLPVESFN